MAREPGGDGARLLVELTGGIEVRQLRDPEPVEPSVDGPHGHADALVSEFVDDVAC